MGLNGFSDEGKDALRPVLDYDHPRGGRSKGGMGAEIVAVCWHRVLGRDRVRVAENDGGGDVRGA